MNKKLILSALVATLAAVFASKHPDGLDKVSQVLGFSGKAVENHAIMSGYQIHFFGETQLSSIFAGIAGVLISYWFFLLCARILKPARQEKN